MWAILTKNASTHFINTDQSKSHIRPNEVGPKGEGVDQW